MDTVGSSGGGGRLRARDAQSRFSHKNFFCISAVFAILYDRGSKNQESGGDSLKLYDARIVARFLDVSPRRVRQLRDDGIITDVRPSLFDLEDCARKYINYLRNRNPDSAGKLDYNEERARLVRAKRKQAENDLLLQENKLHTSEDVESVMTTMLIRFKNNLSALPAKCAPILSKKTDKAEISKILKRNVDEALKELSSFDAILKEMEESDDEESNGGAV